ncbi:hypothetical protein SAMN05660216_01968 [Pseudomonas sp. LAMO17WK12:I8]|nr:hypothetical protein SAMN05660216_01968 [Pseudomonas sp. LAMO17WK12:I8]SNY18139.1 hypothetical protein SAMN05660893_01726 [Pseudomonas sp. LAMO17WK12:I12]SNY19553.1 hypothetical protein SAMN05660344_01971 [Pseudomonas sp. LAMO17WK12:I11]SNY19574.1 hypothetical protein SAMN05660700_01971 [Pseudomonas sp. LAMO17WK12:I7]
MPATRCTDTPSAKWLSAIIKCSCWRHRPKLSPVLLSISLASVRSLVASRVAHSRRVVRSPGVAKSVSAMCLIFGWSDIGKCSSVTDASESCSSRTATNRAALPSERQERSCSTRCRINSRTSGVIASVQHPSGMTAALGSTNRKQVLAFAVTRQLCGVPPGIHTACWGGTSQIAFCTSQLTAPRKDKISWPLR